MEWVSQIESPDHTQAVFDADEQSLAE